MDGSEGIKSTAAETVSANCRKAVSPSSSSTVTLTWCVPGAVGVPDSVKPDSVSQAGISAECIGQGRIAAVAAENVRLNAVPTVAD